MLADGSELQRAISAMDAPGILMGHRSIADGDEQGLLAEECAAFTNCVLKVRRASGGARIVARQLLRELGRADYPIIKAASGAPIWPDGIVGSLAHDAEIAVAALGRGDQYLGIGIDVEPANAVSPDLLDIIATRSERAVIQNDLLLAHVLFAIKEAVYKAVYPLDGQFLNHHEVEVSLTNATAAIIRGRTVAFRYCVAKHIVALAFIPTKPDSAAPRLLSAP